MGLHGYDGTVTAVLFIKIYGEKFWSTVGKHYCMGINNIGATVGYYDVLSRLYDHTL